MVNPPPPPPPVPPHKPLIDRFTKLVERNVGHQRSWNLEGLDDMQIELLLLSLAKSDSNNSPKVLQFGEREARIYSRLVSQRYYGLGHGIGRSGNLTEAQPKAAGSSMIQSLSNELTLQALKVTLRHISCCFVVPMATGMTLLLCLLTVQQWRDKSARFVLWPRSDQKSAPKAIVMAGLEPVPIENIIDGDELKTDIEQLNTKIKELGPENIVCVLSTTSCFAPRGVDDLPAISEICRHTNIPHIVNNAYGLQSRICCDRIERSFTSKPKISHSERNGEDTQHGIDFIVQSCDKNFLVPVGGAIIASYSQQKLEAAKKMYSGRGSMNPNLDMLITLLAMGRNGYIRLLQEQRENFEYMQEKLAIVAAKFDERLLRTKTNVISLAMTLDKIEAKGRNEISFLGSMIFNANITGCRVLDGSKSLSLGKMQLKHFGMHHSDYPHKYINFAVSLGLKIGDIDALLIKFEKILNEFIQH